MIGSQFQWSITSARFCLESIVTHTTGRMKRIIIEIESLLHFRGHCEIITASYLSWPPRLYRQRPSSHQKKHLFEKISNRTHRVLLQRRLWHVI